MKDFGFFLRSNLLKGFACRERDGAIGDITDFYFDDESWTIRYLIVKTGSWLSGRNVLISPISIGDIDLTNKTIHFNLTREQLSNSPTAEQDKPVSRQYEEQFYSYYNFPLYWQGSSRWGFWPVPYGITQAPRPVQTEPVESLGPKTVNQRSFNDISGFSMKAIGGEIGSVKDVLVDLNNWAVRLIEIDTSKWLPSKHVLLSPLWISSFDSAEKQLIVDVPRLAIQDAPAYDPEIPVTEEYESALFEYYQRAKDLDERYVRYGHG